MVSEELAGYISAAFRERFGEKILGTGVRFLPHEACVKVRVQEVLEEMRELAGWMEEEFDELGRRVTIELQSCPQITQIGTD